MKALARLRPPRIRLRVVDLLLGVAGLGLLLGAGVTAARWRRYAALAAQHASQERFCRECAETYRTPEHWNPGYAASAAAEARRQAALKRFYETKW